MGSGDVEMNVAVNVPGEHELQKNPSALNSMYTLNPLEQHQPVSSNGKASSEDIKELQEPDKKMPKNLEIISCLAHLAFFGILGVLTRYAMQKLFGPGMAGITSAKTILYLDLPSNIVGSFFMGWFGVVCKEDISRLSQHLAIALTTGFLGSLTTFSGWNQSMLELTVTGHWYLSLLGFLVGLILVAFSIIFAVKTGNGFKWLLHRLNLSPRSCTCISKLNWKVVTIVLLAVLILLWGVFGALEKVEFKHGGREAKLGISCIVGPFGVWTRWWLARLNGRGLGKAGRFKWLPFGTLVANVSASCVMAALAITKKSLNTTNWDTILSGIQFGLLGCLSTVSTFVSELNAMRESGHPWRACGYSMITIFVSFCFGILIYCVPVWAM